MYPKINIIFKTTCFSWATIFFRKFSCSENFQCRISTYSKLFACFFTCSTVNLNNNNDTIISNLHVINTTPKGQIAHMQETFPTINKHKQSYIIIPAKWLKKIIISLLKKYGPLFVHYITIQSSIFQ